MTEMIDIEVSGDCWNNPEQAKQALAQWPAGKPVMLDLRTEGPSLTALGITDMINDWLTARQQPPESVSITRWSNPVEFVPYRRYFCNSHSHFFSMVKDYWVDSVQTEDEFLNYQNLFGLFLGRMTISRSVILYESRLKYNQHFYTSRMAHTAMMPWYVDFSRMRNQEKLNDWLPLDRQVNMFDWYKIDPVISVDQRCVRDQFVSPTAYIDTNSSLLTHYHNFAIELVCETYTVGNTFFPTEKTLRPVMSGKPIIVNGPKFYLTRLRSLGFKTYNSIWDESYDLYEGPARWNRIKQVIDKIVRLSDSDRQQMLLRAYVIAQYNRKRLQDITNWTVNLTQHDYTKI